MVIEQIVVASCLALLGLAHSAMGESGIIKPLLAAEWTIETPRWATERILRFAWHLTSITWFAVAAAVLGADLFMTIGLMSLASAAIIFVMLRGHLAWPIFLLAGLAALYEAGALTDPMLSVATAATIGTLIAAGLLHVYWALGGRWKLDIATPTSRSTEQPNADQSSPGQLNTNQLNTGQSSSDQPRDFRPGPLLTMFVAALLFVFAAILALAATTTGPPVLRWLAIAGIAVLTLRAIGDTKVAGFTKSVRDTPFGRADDAVFTPLITLLAFGAGSALLL